MTPGSVPAFVLASHRQRYAAFVLWLDYVLHDSGQCFDIVISSM